MDQWKMNRPSAFSRNEMDMMTLCRNELRDDKGMDHMKKLRNMCLSHGATGILVLGRAFRRIVGDNGDDINVEEFTKGVMESGLSLSENEAKDLFEEMDTSGTGLVNMSDFFLALRPPMSVDRKKIVHQAFTKLDRTGDGVLSVADLKRVYNGRSSSQYQSGDVSEEAILNKFLANFEQDGIVDGVVTREEFTNYYAGISASIENNTYFDLVIRQTYKL